MSGFPEDFREVSEPLLNCLLPGIPSRVHRSSVNVSEGWTSNSTPGADSPTASVVINLVVTRFSPGQPVWVYQQMEEHQPVTVPQESKNDKL